MNRKIITNDTSLGKNFHKKISNHKKNNDTNKKHLQYNLSCSNYQVINTNEKNNMLLFHVLNQKKLSNSPFKINFQKSQVILSSKNLINNHYKNDNISKNNIKNKKNITINKKNNNGNLINLNGINISYSEIAKHLHSRKSTTSNIKVKNSNETSLEKTQSSITKIKNQPSNLKILSTQTDKEKEGEKEKEFINNVLLTQEFFFNNSFEKKKRNSSLKYNISDCMNSKFVNNSQIYKNSLSNLNTSNSNSNINIPNLGGSYSFVNNSKTTKDNSSIFMVNSLKRCNNNYNIQTNNSFKNSGNINTSTNNENNQIICNHDNINYKNFNNDNINSNGWNQTKNSLTNLNNGNSNYNRNSNIKSNFVNGNTNSANNYSNSNFNNTTNTNHINNYLLSYNESVKNYIKLNKKIDIEGPENLHFFYVDTLQKNKNLAFKFENCEEDNFFSLNHCENSNTSV